MCVIMWVKDKRPTQEMLDKAWDINGDGGGIAYRVKNEKTGEVEVYWKKGIMDFDEFSDIINQAPTPFVAHFRRRSVGDVNRQMCHPFPIHERTTLALEGKTNGYVLFHNGTWRGWEDAARFAAMSTKIKIPSGKWSDSRALSWLCALFGNGYMEFLPDQRGLAFGPKDLDIYAGPGWYKINDVYCSKDEFWLKGRVRERWDLVCEFQGCTRQDNLDKDDRCPQHKKDWDKYNTPKGSTEVAQTNVTPFPHPALSPSVSIIPLNLAETWYKEGSISRKKVNKIRTAYGDLQHKDQKVRQRALNKLQDISQQLYPTPS